MEPTVQFGWFAKQELDTKISCDKLFLQTKVCCDLATSPNKSQNFGGGFFRQIYIILGKDGKDFWFG